MNFPFFQQFTDWTAPLGFFSDPWRLILIVSLLLLVTPYLLPYLVLHYKKEQLYRLMPSPVRSPILGRIFGHLEGYWNAPAEVKKQPLDVLFNHLLKQIVRPVQETGESLFLFRLGPFHKWVMVIKGEAAKAVLSSRKHLQKSPEYAFFEEFVGESLVNLNVAEWKARRKLIASSFHSEILHKFLPAMNAHSRVFCKVIASQMDGSTGKVLLPDIRQPTVNCTLDILCETVMGVTLNCQGRDGFFQAAGLSTQQIADLFTGTDLLCERLFTPWLHPPFLYHLSALGRKTAKCSATARQFTNSVIAERKMVLSKQIADCATVEQARARLTDGKRLSLLDLLLVSHLKGGEKALNLTVVENEVCEFLIAGVDTTASTLQMALLLLGLHQDKQAFLHQELDAIFANDKERPISLEDIRQMTYLEMCIKEILRLYPGVPLVGRILSEDLQMGKYLVPEGTTVGINIGAINRDPQEWTQADDFLPERFSPDATELGHLNGHLSFSLGSRNCIGSRFAMLDLTIVLATLLRHYTVRSLTGQDNLQLGFFPFAKPNAPISIEFTQRKV